MSFDILGSTIGYNYIYKGMFSLSLLRNELNGNFVNRINGDYCSGGFLEITNEEKFNSLVKEILEDRFFTILIILMIRMLTKLMLLFTVVYILKKFLKFIAYLISL